MKGGVSAKVPTTLAGDDEQERGVRRREGRRGIHRPAGVGTRWERDRQRRAEIQRPTPLAESRSRSAVPRRHETAREHRRLLLIPRSLVRSQHGPCSPRRPAARSRPRTCMTGSSRPPSARGSGGWGSTHCGTRPLPLALGVTIAQGERLLVHEDPSFTLRTYIHMLPSHLPDGDALARAVGLD
jgi:hypothetical protein